MIFLATNNGLVVCESGSEGERAQSRRVARRGLEGQQVTSVIAREGVILVGTRDGIFRSADEGRTWQETSAGLSQRLVRWMAYHPDVSDFEFAGTEPAGIFVSQDGGDTWRECSEVAGLRDRYHWSLPYSPRAGCVRGFAFHGSRAYAAVEVGGVLRSDDGGLSWRLAEGSSGRPDFQSPPEPLIHPDLHSIHVHLTSPDLVFAPTGDGFYSSEDGGKTWRCLYDCYCRAVWVDPADPRHILLGPADHVDRNGRIEETRDGGETWQPASGGLNVPWPRHMVERFASLDSELFAVLSNGELLSTPLDAREWQTVLPEVQGVNAIAGTGLIHV